MEEDKKATLMKTATILKQNISKEFSGMKIKVKKKKSVRGKKEMRQNKGR